MKVLVIGLNGRGLSPTTPRNARVLVKEGKAQVVRKVPYTIRLNYKTGVAGGNHCLGVDTGSQHIGIGDVEDGKVCFRSEFSMRSTMEKRSLNETRREYRRGRRYRKVRYRKPRYKAHTVRRYSEVPVMRNGHMTHWTKKTISYDSNRKKGWLPSSIESKIKHHVEIIRRHVEALPDDAVLKIEVAKFDVARIKDPTVRGEDYQTGPMYDFENVKSYVFCRDGYRCKVCGKKGGSKRDDGSRVKLIAHHIDYRSKGATDNPDRMATACDRCHSDRNHREGGILYEWMMKGKKFRRGYRDMTFMNVLRARLRKEFPDAKFTYGHVTSVDRKSMGLPKTHANDAVAIASSGKPVVCAEETVYYQQVRSRKRSLHEANPRKGRKEPNRSAKRNVKNVKSVTIKKDGKEVTFHVYDKVQFGEEVGWISGFTGTSAYVKNEWNQYVTISGKNYRSVPLSRLKILSHNNNWLTGAREQIGK